ncbi:MAG TPA: radical SAM protein [Desulfonatronum sp.]|nr:radical SAM protein [Desulfonatronum sp.]
MSATPETGRIYTPTSLALRVSYKCNIGCRFCYNTSLPDSTIVMPEEKLLDVIRQCRKNGFRSIGFSGGEVFLFAPTLFKCIRLANDLGYGAVSVVTNGFWGKSAASAGRTMESLAQSGFAPPRDRLSMSAGEFHREFLDWSHAANIAKEHFAFFEQPMRFDFEYSPGKEHLVEDFKACLAEHGVQEHMYFLGMRTFIANIGRWKETHRGPINAKPLHSFKKCNAVNRFVVDPDGKVLPCCGFNRFNQGISLGNVNTSTVADIIEQAQSHAPNRLLTYVPMDAVYAELARAFPLPRDFSVICEVCEAIFSNKEHVDYLAQQTDELLERHAPLSSHPPDQKGC